MKIPLLRPHPPQLSRLIDDLKAIEDSGVFTNYGPVNTRFEAALVAQCFDGVGHCLTVNNATIGLMLALKECVEPKTDSARRFALMPSFTFAATAQAALWAGLTPLLCDIDSETWLPSAASEEELLRRYHGQVAVIVPYATFGNCLDLARYDALARETGIPVVVDAAASLGTSDAGTQTFGQGFRWPVVYSMHATKTFATAEAGLIHCGDAEGLARLRTMGNFGFGQPRSATMPGLNSKLSEIGALLGLAKLAKFEEVVAHREMLAGAYRSELDGFQFQQSTARRLAFQFMPVLLPNNAAYNQGAVISRLAEEGIGVGRYFNPHLAEQPYLRQSSVAGDLTVTQEVARRVLSLPMSDDMTEEEVWSVCAALRRAVGFLS